MSKRDDLKKEIKNEQDEVYGDSTASGSAPDPGRAVNDIEDALENEESESEINPGDEFHLADDVLEEDDRPTPTHHTEEVEEEDEDDNLIK